MWGVIVSPDTFLCVKAHSSGRVHMVTDWTTPSPPRPVRLDQPGPEYRSDSPLQNGFMYFVWLTRIGALLSGILHALRVVYLMSRDSDWTEQNIQPAARVNNNGSLPIDRIIYK